MVRPVAPRARARLRSPRATRSPIGWAGSWSQLLPIQIRGMARLARGGARVTSWASQQRQPSRGQSSGLAPSWPAAQRRLRLRPWRSLQSNNATSARVTRARPTAPGRSPSPCQRSKIAADRVGTPSSCTAPNSLITSIAPRATPAVTAGKARGRATRRKLPQGPTARERHTSCWRAPLRLKASLLSSTT